MSHETSAVERDAPITDASPGPWRIRTTGWGAVHIMADDPRFGARPLPICQVIAHSNSAAHARLISMVPDLLDVLRDVLNSDVEEDGRTVEDVLRHSRRSLYARVQQVLATVDGRS